MVRQEKAGPCRAGKCHASGILRSGDTLPGQHLRWISGQDLATGQQGSRHRGLLFRPPSTRVTASSRRRSALAATQSCPGEPLAPHNPQSLTMQDSQSLDS